MLTYNDTTRSFTCTSTGGPATNVTWRKDGGVISLNEAYQQRQVLTNTTTGTYETVLTIAESVSDIFGIYGCTVENIRGTASASLNATGQHLWHMLQNLSVVTYNVCTREQVIHSRTGYALQCPHHEWLHRILLHFPIGVLSYCCRQHSLISCPCTSN